MTEDDIAQLKAFAKAVIRQSWDGGIDGHDVADLSVKHGLIVAEIYDPAVHGNETNHDAEIGDEILVFSQWMKD